MLAYTGFTIKLIIRKALETRLLMPIMLFGLGRNPNHLLHSALFAILGKRQIIIVKSLSLSLSG